MRGLIQMKNRKGNINLTAVVSGAIAVIIGIIVIMNIIGNTSGSIVDATENITGSGLPFASLFSSSGVVMLIFMAGVLLAIMGMAFKMAKQK